MIEEKKNFDVEKMSLDTQDLDEFVMSKEVDRNRLSMAFVAGGQGGGKIAAEFCRFGYPLIAYNTCKEDLDDLQEYVNKMKNRGPFVRIDLEGENGASKDRDLGLKAIKDNLPMIKKDLLVNDDIYNADFVWIVVALGGGTGNGSLTSVTKLISAYVREDKKIYRGGEYKSTIGVIAAIPDQTAKSKIRLNVAKALEELESLQESGDLGAVLLVDNQKLIDDFNKNYDEKRDADKTWATDGNNKVARIITELALSTSLKSSEMLDKSEMLDIWSTPGFMSIGKRELGEVWMSDKGSELKDILKIEQNVETESNDIEKKRDLIAEMLDKCIELEEELKTDKNVPVESNDTEKKREFIAKMLTKSFSEGVFVEGVALDTAIHGGMIVITDGKTINNRDAKELEYVLNQRVLNSDTIEAPHFGFVRTELIGTVKEKAAEDSSSGSGKVFTMCVTKGAPEHIEKWFEDTISSRKKHIEAMEKANEKVGLQGLTDEISLKKIEPKKKQPSGISLDDLFGDVNKINGSNKARKRNLDALDNLFAGLESSSEKEPNTAEKQNDMLNELFNRKN